MVSYMVTLSVTSCIRSLSEETMMVVAPRSPARGHSGDQVVGLEAALLEAGQSKARTASRISGNCGIRSSGAAAGAPCNRVQLVAEGDSELVEHMAEMGRPVVGWHVAPTGFHSMLQKPSTAFDLQAVGLAVQRGSAW